MTFNPSEYKADRRRRGYKDLMVWLDPGTNAVFQNLQLCFPGMNNGEIVSLALHHLKFCQELGGKPS